YGGGRFLSDFIRPEKMVAGLTGSQLTSLAAIAVALSWVALFRPQRRTPYAWTPPEFSHGWGDAGSAAEVTAAATRPADDDALASELDEGEVPEVEEPAARDRDAGSEERAAREGAEGSHSS
ncbi:MAG TPA: hypothetical protein VML96_04225, partial [Egibacteraceae bacterium]|nr:hypothetical protein [Egibacteraceae bacterium]